MSPPTTKFSFFFSSRRRHTRCGRDWSSDVCSSDLRLRQPLGHPCGEEGGGAPEPEAEGLVEPDGTGVLRAGVQERGLAALAYAVRDGQDQPGREALTADGGVGADRADLGP